MGDALELGTREYFANWVMTRWSVQRRGLRWDILTVCLEPGISTTFKLGRHTYNHARLGGEGPLELVKVDSPISSGRCPLGAIGRRVQGNVLDDPTRHLNVADILVKERLEDNDLIAGLDETHEGAQHALSVSFTAKAPR